jgi:hypothetical protein
VPYNEELNSLLELLCCMRLVEPEFFLYPVVKAFVPIVLEVVLSELALFLVGVPDPPCLVFELPLYY